MRFSGKPLPLQFREEVSKQGNSNTYNTPFPTEFTPDRRAFTQDKIMDGILSFILFLIIGFYVAGLIGRVLLRRWIMRKQKDQGEQIDFWGYTLSDIRATGYGIYNRSRDKTYKLIQRLRYKGEQKQG